MPICCSIEASPRGARSPLEFYVPRAGHPKGGTMPPVLGAARRALASALLGILRSAAHAAGAPRAVAAERPGASSTITFEKASEYYQEANWPLASSAFEAVVKREPANARAWHRLGVCRQ